MKKIIIVILVLLLAGGGFFTYRTISAKKQTEQKKVVTSKKRNPVNILDLDKRPYITLVPRVDGHEVSMTIDNLHYKEDMVEYELEYQAGTMLQGAGGRIDFSVESAPITKKLLFGSCSKGKCKYDDNVSAGSLTLYFEGKEDYSLKGEFTIAIAKENEGIFQSRDVKVSLDTGASLEDNTFVITASTMGLPQEVEGEVLAGPIGFFTANKQTIKKATLTFKGISETENLKVLGWDGIEWQEYGAEIEENTVVAEVNQLTTFVLVK